MKKSRKVATSIVAMLGVLAIGSTLLAGCGSNANQPSNQSQVEMCSITWEIPDNVTVTVDDYETLPTSIEIDTAISFSVTVPQGYAVDSVKSNNKKVTLKNGKYTIGVTRDTTVTITISEAISDLKVVTMPNKLSYIAGEEIDLTGMVVEVTSGISGKQNIEYGENGYSVYPTMFEGGESSFEITYKSLKIDVPLEGIVEFLVTIDANGGTFSSAYLADLAGRNLHHYKHENGVITFTYYNNLAKPVKLPTEDDVNKDRYALTGWSFEEKSISNFTSANVNAKASWQFEIVKIKSVSLVKEDKPYLVISGTYRAAEEVYLYLYEGNAHVELIGDTYTGHSGENFEVKFDLTKLSEKGDAYEGKWMDIRFNALYDGKTESMEIFTTKASGVEVDTSSKVAFGDYAYSFHVYSNALKVDFTKTSFSYEVSCLVKDGADYIRIAGQVKDSAYYNKYVEISWWHGSAETEGVGTTISATGAFVIDYPLAGFSPVTNAFAHIGIYEDSTKGVTLFGGINQNVLISNIFTNMPTLASKKGDITNAFVYTGSDSRLYYVGYAWDGLMLYVVEGGAEVEMLSAKVEERAGTVYYVASGKCIGLTSETFLYSFYFQHINGLDGLGEGDVYDDNEVSSHAVVNPDGTFEISCPISTAIGAAFKESTQSMWGLIAKYYFLDAEKDKIEIKPADYDDNYVEKDGVRYSIYASTSLTWDIACLILEKI